MEHADVHYVAIVLRCYEDTMQETLTIRPARTDELSVCASFWIAMFEETGLFYERDLPEDWRERFVRYFSMRIAADEARYFVAVDGERIVGTAGALVSEGYAAIMGRAAGYIFGVCVEREYRGRGLATALTPESIAFLKEKRCKRIRLHASPAGRPIYERLGFEPTNEMQLRD